MVPVHTPVYGLTDVEQAVLGACLLDSKALPNVRTILADKVFFSERHRLIYAAMCRLADEAKPVDKLTVMQCLSDAGTLTLAGGPYALAQLTSRVASAANVEYHAALLAEEWMRAQLHYWCTSVAAKPRINDPIDVATRLMAACQDVLSKLLSGRAANKAEQIEEAKRLIELLHSSASTAISTGLPSIDQVLGGGLHAGELTVIGARPGVGKTAFALSLARSAERAGNWVQFYSAEMQAAPLLMRIVSAAANVPFASIRQGECNDCELLDIQQALAEYQAGRMVIHDQPAMDVAAIVASARTAARLGQCSLVVVDYLQLVAGQVPDRRLAVGAASRALKMLAKELNVPVVALAQVSRDVNGKTVRPEPFHLKESGDIEQDADNVLMLFRPYMQGVLEFEDGTPTEGQAVVYTAKQRNGEAGPHLDVHIRWEAEYQRFEENRAPTFYAKF